jgi:hypothetical protein
MRLGKVELGHCVAALAAYAQDGEGRTKAAQAAVDRLLEKLKRELESKTGGNQAALGVAAAPIHAALVTAAKGKVPDMSAQPAGWWANLSRQLFLLNATVEQAACIGAWLATQTWAQSFGWSTIVKNWADWSSRAALEERSRGGHSPGGAPGGRAQAW